MENLAEKGVEMEQIRMILRTFIRFILFWLHAK